MNQTETLTDRLATDLDASFPEFVEVVQRGLYSGALRMTGSPADAADIAQESLIRAYRALQGYPPERIRRLSLRGWVWTIAANLCRNEVRRRSRMPQVQMIGVDPVHPDPGPEDEAIAGDARRHLAVLVGDLPWPMRAGVVLRHVVGLGYEEIAEALERPVGTVKADVHRALTRLRDTIDREETP